MSTDPTHPFTFLHTITTPAYEKDWFAVVIENEIFGLVVVLLVAVVAAIRFQGRWHQRLAVAAVTIAGGVFSIWIMELLRIMRTPMLPVSLCILCSIGFAMLASSVMRDIAKQKAKAEKSTHGRWVFKVIACGLICVVLVNITIYTLPAVAMFAYYLYLQWPGRAPALPKPGDEARKFDALLLRADKGEAAAQYELGKMYQTGAGVELSEIGALIWYQKAAAQGHVEAKRSAAEIESRMAGWKPN